MIVRIRLEIMENDMTEAWVLNQFVPSFDSKTQTPRMRTECNQKVSSRAGLLNTTDVQDFMRKIRCLTRS